MTEIEFVKLDPFNVACFDKKENKILIDSAVKNAPILKKIIAHEKRHVKDPILDPVSEEDFKIFPEVLKFKPLMFLQFIFPFVLGRRKDLRWIFQIDFLGLLIVAFLIFVISFTATYSETRCEVSPLTHKNIQCWTCRITGCVTNLFNSTENNLNYG